MHRTRQNVWRKISVLWSLYSKIVLFIVQVVLLYFFSSSFFLIKYFHYMYLLLLIYVIALGKWNFSHRLLYFVICVRVVYLLSYRLWAYRQPFKIRPTTKRRCKWSELPCHANVMLAEIYKNNNMSNEIHDTHTLGIEDSTK